MSIADQNGAKQRLLSVLQGLARQGWRDAIAVGRAPDELDEVQQATDRELELAAMERDAALANQVRLALRRLDQGEYGTCLHCGRKIGSKRLEALPWASMCVRCQGHAEAQRERQRISELRPEPSARTNGTTHRNE